MASPDSDIHECRRWRPRRSKPHGSAQTCTSVGKAGAWVLDEFGDSGAPLVEMLSVEQQHNRICGSEDNGSGDVCSAALP